MSVWVLIENVQNLKRHTLFYNYYTPHQTKFNGGSLQEGPQTGKDVASSVIEKRPHTSEDPRKDSWLGHADGDPTEANVILS